MSITTQNCAPPRNRTRRHSAWSSSGSGLSRHFLDMPKLALPPDRTGDKYDNDAQYPADDFGAMSAAGEARRDAHRRQHCVKTCTKRAVEDAMQHRRYRGI